MNGFFKKAFCIAFALAAALASAACVPSLGELEERYDDDGKQYELAYYLMYNDSNPPNDLKSVEARLNAALKAKLPDTTVKLTAYTIAEYTAKLSGAIAANVKFDICYTSPEVNPYLTNVQREAFLPLDYLLPTYAPETWAAIPENIWTQARVDGKIYASVNEQIFPRTYCYDARNATLITQFLNAAHPGTTTDTVNELGMDAFAFMEEYMAWLKANDRGAGGKISSIDTESALQNWFGYDNLGTGMSTPGVVDIEDGSYTVVNQYASQDYRNLIDTVYRWKSVGYIEEGVSVFDLTPESNWKPGYRRGNILKLSDPHYFTSYVIGTMNAISSTSKNPARAMKFIELLRTDAEIHNILQFGVEDVHYIKDPENPVRIAEQITGSGYNNAQFGWGLGCEFVSYLTPSQPADLWEQVKKINADTPVSPLVGFNFNVAAVKQKIADCKAVVNEFAPAFASAQFKNKDDKLAEFLSRLNAAGANEVVAEKQKQLDAYLAARGIAKA
ncbi:MAG: ABC transporter substrate-binding protein [Clostridiales bacterium]|jgi:putative aldouronate transport system substrate-binding protein|nr:ABC transporter substrate-binding protein [Clostridiales bacterium]